MGSWGPGVFENDDAGDWVWELEDDEDGSVLIAALSAVVDTPVDEHLEAPECSNALAAAEVVASARGPVTPGLPGEAIEWIRQHAGLVDRGLLALASGAVERVALDSELRELWADDTAWSESVADLLARLR